MESNLTNKERTSIGKISAVQGPVVDVRFDEKDEAPAIYDCIETYAYDGKKKYNSKSCQVFKLTFS